jgi:hypothetical protein
MLLGSPRFIQKYSDIELPLELDAKHPWAEVRRLDQMCDGPIDLFSGGTSVRFWWQGWWNSYSLLVLLRRKPTLSLVARLINK